MKRTLCALLVVAGVMGVAASAVAGPPIYGEGAIVFPGSLVWAPGGRLVYLDGAIKGTNFEPGICATFDPSDPTSICPIFTKTEPALNSGGFLRAHDGQTAFTICDPCTLEDEDRQPRTGSFILRISYPNPKNLLFTKFTIQNASGGLAGLQGQGTLDFSTVPPSYSLRYHFEPR
jgi:hypothetical protein